MSEQQIDWANSEPEKRSLQLNQLKIKRFIHCSRFVLLIASFWIGSRLLFCLKFARMDRILIKNSRQLKNSFRRVMNNSNRERRMENLVRILCYSCHLMPLGSCPLESAMIRLGASPMPYFFVCFSSIRSGWWNLRYCPFSPAINNCNSPKGKRLKVEIKRKFLHHSCHCIRTEREHCSSSCIDVPCNGMRRMGIGCCVVTIGPFDVCRSSANTRALYLNERDTYYISLHISNTYRQRRMSVYLHLDVSYIVTFRWCWANVVHSCNN